MGEYLFPVRKLTNKFSSISSKEDLQNFVHPLQAMYILGPEKGSLSSETLSKADHIVKIPTSFSLNVAIAGAIVMYDRIKTLGIKTR